MAAKKKKSSWILKYCKAQLGRPYWRGTFGQHATPALLEFERRRFPESYKAADFEAQAKAGQKVHDCCGLLKGAMLCDTINGAPDSSQLKYYDLNPKMLYDAASTKSDCMQNFPDIPAYLVYNSNKSHVGVYVGGGEVVEARGHVYGVVKSSINDARWKFWSNYCFADYSDIKPKKADEVKYTELEVCRKGSKGDAVRTIQANVHVFVDGVFGSDTEKAVKDFQKKHKDNDGKALVCDGVVGAKTWEAIINKWSAKK